MNPVHTFLAMHMCMFLVCHLMCAAFYSIVCVIRIFDLLYDFLSMLTIPK